VHVAEVVGVLGHHERVQDDLTLAG
jgi:hypothetical protein